MCTFKLSASNWKYLLLWEGQDTFVLRSVLTGKIDCSVCREKYFILLYLWQKVERGNTENRKICVISIEQQIRNSLSSWRIKSEVCFGTLCRLYLLPLDSFSFLSCKSWIWCPFSVPMSETYRTSLARIFLVTAGLSKAPKNGESSMKLSQLPYSSPRPCLNQ